MSNAAPLDPVPPPTEPFGLAGGSIPVPGPFLTQTGSVDPLLIQQTKNEIRSLVQEITHLTRAAIPVEQFYEEFLRRVVSALAAHGGAVWTLAEGRELQAQYQVNLPPECLNEGEEAATRHQRLIRNVLASGQATLVPPRSGGAGGDEAGNSTEFLLVLAPLRVEMQPIGVIEILQRPGGGPTTQRGYLRFLVQMSELATEFLRNRRLRSLDDRQALWDELEQFIRRVHRYLDSRAVAYAVVNEGRRLTGCDRVSVSLARGRSQQVLAVSGLDTIDRRAGEAKLLSRLATSVCAARRPLWYAGRQRDLPPQIEQHLDAYLDRSHTAALAILPLERPHDDSEPANRTAGSEPLGALIVEQLNGHPFSDSARERAEVVAVHSASALCNAVDHESLFLLPVWRVLGRARWVVRARTLPKTLLVLAAVLATGLLLAWVPADFDLAARGKLQPTVRRDVFAHVDGVVSEVPVRHGQMVQPGEVLARLQNNSLELETADLIGRKRATQERIRSLQRAQLDGRRLRIEEQNRISGELLELLEVEAGIDRELELLSQMEEQLVVRSELRGQVVTWNVGTLLMRRPVRRGQLLMTVQDPAGPWELELYMPERRMGHVIAAVAGCQQGLPVTFLLASYPDRRFQGRVVEVHRSADVHGDEGNSVLLRVAIDQHDLPDLRSETTVTARVHCGRRPIGLVWFHELIETFESKVLFWI